MVSTKHIIRIFTYFLCVIEIASFLIFLCPPFIDDFQLAKRLADYSRSPTMENLQLLNATKGHLWRVELAIYGIYISIMLVNLYVILRLLKWLRKGE